MTILSKKETGMGGSWILVDYGNKFFAYGYIQDSERLLDFPVDQCGSKKKVLEHCNLIARMCEQNIKRYQKESVSGTTLLIESEQKQLEVLREFARVLSQ